MKSYLDNLLRQKMSLKTAHPFIGWAFIQYIYIYGAYFTAVMAIFRIPSFMPLYPLTSASLSLGPTLSPVSPHSMFFANNLGVSDLMVGTLKLSLAVSSMRRIFQRFNCFADWAYPGLLIPGCNWYTDTNQFLNALIPYSIQ